jgi:hypothetical protein
MDHSWECVYSVNGEYMYIMGGNFLIIHSVGNKNNWSTAIAVNTPKYFLRLYSYSHFHL